MKKWRILKKENIGFRLFRGGLSAATKSEITSEFKDDKLVKKYKPFKDKSIEKL